MGTLYSLYLALSLWCPLKILQSNEAKARLEAAVLLLQLDLIQNLRRRACTGTSCLAESATSRKDTVILAGAKQPVNYSISLLLITRSKDTTRGSWPDY